MKRDYLLNTLCILSVIVLAATMRGTAAKVFVAVFGLICFFVLVHKDRADEKVLQAYPVVAKISREHAAFDEKAFREVFTVVVNSSSYIFQKDDYDFLYKHCLKNYSGKNKVEAASYVRGQLEDFVAMKRRWEATA